MITVTEERVSLGPFAADLAARRLLRDGVELPLRPRAFRVLQILVQNRGKVIEYDKLVDDAWDGISVSKHTVAVTVSEIKNALGEYGSWITCRRKFGYCLEVPVSEELLRRGWHFRNQFTLEGFENALGCFEEAARHDGTDPRSFEAIANTYLMLAVFLMRPPRQMYHAFLAAHKQAVGSRGLTPELRADLAYFRLNILEQRLVDVEAELRTVQKERPMWADVYVRLAMVYSAFGRLDDALKVLQEAQAVDELIAPLAFVETVVRLFRREFDAAVECGKRATMLHPGSQFGRIFYAQALEFRGEIKEALKQYQLAGALAPDTNWIRALEARCLAKNGRAREAIAILQDIERLRVWHYIDAYHMAILLEALGRREEALRELHRAYEDGSAMLLWMDVDPRTSSMRDDLPFIHLRDKVLASIGTGSALS